MVKLACLTDRSVVVINNSVLFFLIGQEVAQPVEPVLPARTPLGEPLLGESQAGRRDVEGANAPDLLRMDESAGFEDLQVLADGGERHGQRACELGHGGWALAEALDESATGGIGEGLEDTVEVGGALGHTKASAILKQML
jgi:hypothetical protein